MAITRRFTEEELEELDARYSPVDEEIVGRTRWGVLYDTVFKDENGEYWQFTWEDGATESQDYDSFDFEDYITATKVERKSIVVDKWVPVEH